MSHFTQDFFDFFDDLSENNNREWFQANRKRYEKSVKEPFAAFTNALIKRVREHEPDVDITAKDAVMRINRDIRFSPDKTPYHTYVGAFISAAGRKDKSRPGSFVRIDTRNLLFAGGAYSPDKEQLLRIRTAIAHDLDGFDALLNDEDFKEKFGTLPGEKHKRLPPEFKEVAERQPLIANKQFHYYAEIDATLILEPYLIDRIMTYYLAGKRMNAFLKLALYGGGVD